MGIVEKEKIILKIIFPDLTSLVVIPYDNGMLAFGSSGVNSGR